MIFLGSEKSIAVIGASADRKKFGNKCVRAYNSLGWQVFPINPKEEEIEGLKCYHSITNLPFLPSRVSIYLPPQITANLIPAFSSLGVKEVFLNPGAESDELIQKLKAAGIKPVLKCSIVFEGLSPSTFN